MKKKQRILWGVAAGMFLCTQAWALNIPGRTSHKVNDYAGVIDPVTKNKLEILLNRFQALSPRKIEFIVTTMPSIKGMSLNRFFPAYAAKWWRLWPFEKHHRIHFLIIMDTGQMQLGVGHPLENELPSVKSLQILDEKVIPYFEQKLYSDGIAMGVINVIEVFGGAD